MFRADPDRAARFEREARLLASLNHPHIASIHGLEQTDSEQFIAMELVEGETLADRIRQGDVWASAMSVIQACETLAKRG